MLSLTQLPQQPHQEKSPMRFLREHPAAGPDPGVSPCWLLSPSCCLPTRPSPYHRCLASPGCLFPGREHGWQHLWQLRQGQPRALRQVRQEVGTPSITCSSHHPPQNRAVSTPPTSPLISLVWVSEATRSLLGLVPITAGRLWHRVPPSCPA